MMGHLGVHISQTKKLQGTGRTMLSPNCDKRMGSLCRHSILYVQYITWPMWTSDVWVMWELTGKQYVCAQMYRAVPSGLEL